MILKTFLLNYLTNVQTINISTNLKHILGSKLLDTNKKKLLTLQSLFLFKIQSILSINYNTKSRFHNSIFFSRKKIFLSKTF